MYFKNNKNRFPKVQMFLCNIGKHQSQQKKKDCIKKSIQLQGLEHWIFSLSLYSLLDQLVMI